MQLINIRLLNQRINVFMFILLDAYHLRWQSQIFIVIALKIDSIVQFISICLMILVRLSNKNSIFDSIKNLSKSLEDKKL